MCQPTILLRTRTIEELALDALALRRIEAVLDTAAAMVRTVAFQRLGIALCAVDMGLCRRALGSLRGVGVGVGTMVRSTGV